MNVNEVFESLESHAKEHGLSSLSVTVSDLSGHYVAAYNTAGKCGIGKTVEEAIGKLPKSCDMAYDLICDAEKKEQEAMRLREKAASILENEKEVVA